MGDEEQPTTPAGRYLTRRMVDLGFRSKAELADAAGVARSTITRLYKRAEYRPDIDVMRRLARALQIEHDELVAAIYGETIAQTPVALHPLAAELGRMLAPDSPLSESASTLLELLVDRTMEPSRREMRPTIVVEGAGDVAIIRKLTSGRVHVTTVAKVEQDPDPESFLVAQTRERVHRLLDPDGPLDAKTRYTLQAAIANILDLVEKPPKRAEQLRDAEAQEMFEATMAELGRRQADARER